ncbi:MAG: hypothetical protein V3T83_22095 [Acidobacteriota bacterium]
MWLIWTLFWTVAVVCRVASQDSGPTANLLLFALGCAAAAGVGWATAACKQGGKSWKEAIALMLGWSLAYVVGKPAVDFLVPCGGLLSAGAGNSSTSGWPWPWEALFWAPYRPPC